MQRPDAWRGFGLFYAGLPAPGSAKPPPELLAELRQAYAHRPILVTEAGTAAQWKPSQNGAAPGS